MNKNIGIIGYGEIGSAVYSVYIEHTNNVFVRDLDRDDGLKDINILNVSIPYSDRFIEICSNYIDQYKPTDFVIIHSTVIPGTTKKLIENTGFQNIVHSPVRGIHPKLYDGLKTFTKFVGTENKSLADLIVQHYRELGINAEHIPDSTSTELAKILSTTYYGMCIAWHGYAHELCLKHGVMFNDVMTKFNETYNEGYKKLGKENVVRPVLYPPGDKIGGHCVIPNTELLKTLSDSKVLDFILRFK